MEGKEEEIGGKERGGKGKVYFISLSGLIVRVNPKIIELRLSHM